ncbi:MAG: D-alanyl-D-alanine carboxypeptidase [Erysipelotrichaceae bacterium]|nr:D-alanyl-D-alanine carboxypeptidase [Erysipelotrichaceae bacterium]MDY3934482.1 D-alanyl-D-alanine carboxypeptidase family protein [Bacilli bacterium]
MKKILLLLFVMLSLIYTPRVNASTESATSYVLLDQDTNRVLLSKNKDKPMLIASITKIMTCIIALENKNISDLVVVDDSIKESYGSGIYISVGEEITLKDLLYGLMLRSGNDAAIMISTYVSGSVDSFVDLMNQKAKEIGMKNTVFHNPSGLDNNTIGNTSTAYDMALLTSYAMQNKTYREIVKTKKYTAKTNLKTYIWHNKNKLLQYDYITGGKTGYTEKAKRTLVSTASKNNLNLVVVTIKDSDDWNTHKSLYEYAFDNYKSYNILNKKTFSIPKDKYYDSLYIKNDVSIILNINETKNVISHIKLEKKKHYKNNEKVGTSYIYVGKKLVHKEDIYARKTNKKESIFKRIF